MLVPFPSIFPGTNLQGTGLEVEQPGMKPVPIQDAGASVSLTARPQYWPHSPDTALTESFV